MKRLIIFTALSIALGVIIAIFINPHMLLNVAGLTVLLLLLDFLWHCAGNLARGRLEEER